MTSVFVRTSVHALLVASALALTSLAASAETTPRPGSHDNRVRIATWTEGQVYRIVTTLTRVTTVEFGEGETIRSIIAGDTVGFQFDGVPGGRLRDQACCIGRRHQHHRLHEPPLLLLPRRRGAGDPALRRTVPLSRKPRTANPGGCR